MWKGKGVGAGSRAGPWLYDNVLANLLPRSRATQPRCKVHKCHRQVESSTHAPCLNVFHVNPSPFKLFLISFKECFTDFHGFADWMRHEISWLFVILNQLTIRCIHVPIADVMEISQVDATRQIAHINGRGLHLTMWVKCKLRKALGTWHSLRS